MLTGDECKQLVKSLRAYEGRRPATTEQLLSATLARINDLQHDVRNLTQAALALAVVYKEEKMAANEAKLQQEK